MIQDRGPKQNLSFGIPLIEGEPNPDSVDSGISPESGAIAKYLGEKPLLKFATVAVASMVSLHVAGKVASHGGYHIAAQAQKAAQGSGWLAKQTQEGLVQVRKVQQLLDELQGVSRKYVDPEDTSIFAKRDRDGNWIRHEAERIDSAHHRAVANDLSPGSVPEWELRDELQQRLVRQARRLPYELPGFYLADKAIIDPLTGDSDRKPKVNWYNPVDVLGDFAWESVKNVTTAVLPFETLLGSGSHAYQRLLKTMSAPGGAQSHSMGVLTTQAILEQLGVKAGEVVNSTVRFSSQSLGAFSNAVEAMSKERRTFTDLARSARANAGSASRPTSVQSAIAQGRQAQAQALDAMPGPFKGMATGLRTFRDSYKKIGNTYDDWQNVLQGHTTLADLEKLGSGRADRVRNFMRQGGGSHVEQVADQMHKLGIRSVTTSSDVVARENASSSLYNVIRETQYKQTLADKLVDVAGLERGEAVKFVTHASKIALPEPKVKNTDEILNQRFQIGKRDVQARSGKEFWDGIVRDAGKTIDLSKTDLDKFTKAVNLADRTFLSRPEQALLQARYSANLTHITEEIIPQHVGASIASSKVDYQSLKQGLAVNDNYLVRNTAKAMGIRNVDSMGSPLDLQALRREIKSRGLDADDKSRMLGFLVDKKVVKAPWQKQGSSNLFGFTPVSMQEAIDGGFFAGQTPGARKELNKIIGSRVKGMVGPGGELEGRSASEALGSLRMKGVYRSASGQVVDLGRIRRGFTSAVDSLATETQIPVLGFNPAQLFFHGSRMSARQAAPIQFASKFSLQNVAQRSGTKGVTDPDLYMYLRKEGKSKGKLFGLKDSLFGDGTTSRQYAGEYRPFIANRASMTGRYSELYLGQSSIPGSETHSNKWMRRFDVATEQENKLVGGKDSFFGRLVSNLRGTEDSYRNPRKLARALADGKITPEEIARNPIYSESFDTLVNQTKGYGFPEGMIDKLIKRGVIDQGSPLALLHAPEASVIQEVRDTLTSDLASGLSDTGMASLRRAQKPLKTLLNQADNQTNFLSLPAPRNVRTVGVSRRLDQLRSEISEYIILRSDQFKSDGLDFSTRIAKIFSSIDDMYSTGQISKAQRSEYRTATLSMQLQHSRNKVYDSIQGKWRPDLNAETLKDAMGGSAAGRSVREALGEYGSYAPDGSSISRRILSKAKTKLAPADYRGPTEINAIGAPYTFVPTIATGFSMSPFKTIKGLTTTWSDPDAVTSGSLFSTHMASRINGYFQSIGLGLDLHKYKGPLDFYARGVIGKRVLPAYVAGTTAMTLDRTAGGLVNDRDEEGNRIYSPLAIGVAARGVAEAQVGLAGLIPGGQTASQKREEIFEGEVPVRQGRYWLLNSNTPFKGGRVQYFRPSWYQRLKAGGEYTPEMNQTPLEQLAFGYDFSPLRPLDPYRFERQNKDSRPYPLTGQYFSGPFGPLTSALNATVGRVLKPTLRMHEEDTAAALASYTPVGAGAAVSISTVSQTLSSINSSYMNLAGSPGASSTGPFYGASGFTQGRGIASSATRGTQASLSKMYEGLAAGGNYPGVYAPLVSQGLGMANTFGASIVPSRAVVQGNQNSLRAGRFGFEAQEMAGIYGFGSGSVRQALGFGSQDFSPKGAVLESADKGYSASRSFWGLNLGGLGDAPLPIEGRFANLEFSEIVRRFVPREQQGIQYINGIPNTLGQQYPWLPGPGSMNNLTQGDPYGRLPDASIRLPGTGRDRVTRRFPDQAGERYGAVDIHAMLGDLDPFGDNYRAVDRMISSNTLSPLQNARVSQTRAQVEAMGIKNEFTPYKYQDLTTAQNIAEATANPIIFSANRAFEYLAHRDTFINSKFLRTRTALEDWERDNVYGSTYPSWSSPIDSFIQPLVNKSTQRDPFSAASATAVVGSMFGSSARAKAMGTVLGGTTGLLASAYGKGYEALTGNRFIPRTRKKELMLEEQADILSYVHSMTNASRAYAAGDETMASYFLQRSTKTMYGANLNDSPERLAQALPSRKREHFEAMMYASERDREQILSTAGRLERRLLQAAWGQKVERLPDLQEYFEGRELPGPESSFWSPYTDIDSVKIKIGQRMGLDMSQMGYYPQQIQEANMINPVYPEVFNKESGRSVRAKLMQLMGNLGISGDVQQRPTPFSGGDNFQLTAGI